MLIGKFFLKGFCLEKLAAPSSSKFKLAEHEEKVMECYEKAGDLAILYFQVIIHVIYFVMPENLFLECQT